MSQFYGPADDAQSVVTIRTALDLGVDFPDTSDIHGAADVNLGAPERIKLGTVMSLLSRMFREVHSNGYWMNSWAAYGGCYYVPR
jgi:hypothetical protein